MIIGVDGIEANVEQKVGVSVYTVELLSYFQRSANKDTRFIVYLRSHPLPDLPQENDYFKYEIVPSKGFWRDLFFPIHLYLHRSIDVLFCPAHYVPRWCPVPTVVTIHDLAYEFFPDEFTKKDLYKLTHWTRQAVQASKRVIAVSQSTAHDLHSIYGTPRKKIFTVYNGYSVFSSSEKSSLEDYNLKPQSFFVYIGTLQPRKNIPTLLKAFATFHETHKDIKLVIVGKKGWLYQGIFQEAQRLNLGKAIIFTGYVKNLEVFYKNALAYVLPSLYEGFGLPVIEAMHYACPVIVSTTPALKEVGGDACLTFDPHDTIALTQRLEKILIPSVRRTLIEKGTKRAKQFSWEKTSEKTLQIIKDSTQK